MENELWGIGAMASLSGLPVSALRFYDGAGVLRPAVVDPRSGYRSYRPSQLVQARLVAHLRRVGLPLDDITTVVTEPAAAGVDPGRPSRPAGSRSGRRPQGDLHRPSPSREHGDHHAPLTLPAADLVRALREVRYAVCADPAQPRLAGVFLDSEPGQVRLVATDRYRLATSTVATSEQTELHLLLPTTAVDELLAGDGTGSFDIAVTDGTVTLAGDGGTVRAQVPDVDFPPYRRLLDLGRRHVPVDAAALRAALDAGPTETRTRDDDGAAYDVSRLSVTHVESRSVPPTTPTRS